MNCDVHFYQLVPKNPLGSIASGAVREGALLRVRYSDRTIGYADCHPWPELGDLPIRAQLDLLQKGQFTELTRRSLEFAFMDGQARTDESSLWDNIKIPPSHALVSDIHAMSPDLLESLADQGFTRLKIKLGSNPLEEAGLLSDLRPVLSWLDLKIRLDFNSSLSPTEVDQFLQNVGGTRESIDFIEDPTLYDPQIWAEIQKRWGIRLALDRYPQDKLSELSEEAFSVLIVKPAIQDIKALSLIAKKFKMPVVVTSYLDHPFGQFCAAWTAGLLTSKNYKLTVEPCGLLSHFAYQPHEFSKVIQSVGPQLIAPQGTGFGMDDLLADLEWSPIEERGGHA